MLPYFYHKELDSIKQQFVLNEETSKHCVQVLRMLNGEKLQLTNGLGLLCTVEIIEANKRNTIVRIIEKSEVKSQNQKVSIAISLLKNASRFEWFLEKATEIGVTEIIPLISKRTERQSFKFDRLNSILIAAMLQSQQAFLPKLHQPIYYNDLFTNQPISQSNNKLIAHCLEENKTPITEVEKIDDAIILIGPEGDFTLDEIEIALENNFKPVTLGNTRLRTETAGIVAATLLVNK
jgi:16S rRNA (uracil1498-N3)-methyltransferase